LFGYIKPYKPEMKMGEFDTFKAIYCGLCKQLSAVYGKPSTLTLSYDFTFLTAVYLGMSQECEGFEKRLCVANPLRKKVCHNACKQLDFSAAAAMIMVYYKVIDDIKDSGFWGKLRSIFLYPFAYFPKRKATRLYPELDEILKQVNKQQAIAEKSEDISIDRCAHPTANALSLICESFSEDTKQKKILNRFGYLVGRYVYFADALDDLESDIKKHEFNPFVKKHLNKDVSIDEIKQEAVGTINVTIAEIASAFELLELKRYKPILENIIYLGLSNTIKSIINKKQEDNTNSHLK